MHQSASVMPNFVTDAPKSASGVFWQNIGLKMRSLEICKSLKSLESARCIFGPIFHYSLSNPINLTAYDNDNVTKVLSGNEYDSGAYVLVNKTLDDDGDKINKPFKDPTDPVALDMPAEARKVELKVVALDDGDGTTDTYTVKLKLDSIDPSASDKVAIWQVPEGGVEAIQSNWVLKAGGTEGMTPAIPILTMTEGDDPKTLTLWFEGREPVVDSGMPIRLVAELYKGTNLVPMVTDAIKLNPIEISYLRPALVEVTEDVEELHCQTVAVGRVSSTNAWISEVMAEPGSGHAKWIELYNPTNEDIVFTSDNVLVANETEHFLAGDTIPAKGFLVLANDADDDGLDELSNVVYKGGLNPVGDIEIYEGESVVLTADVGDSTTGTSRYFAFNDPYTDEQVWWDSALPWTGSGELLGSPGAQYSGGSLNLMDLCELEVDEDAVSSVILKTSVPGTPPEDGTLAACKSDYTDSGDWCEVLPNQIMALDANLIGRYKTGEEEPCGHCHLEGSSVSETCKQLYDNKENMACTVPFDGSLLYSQSENSSYRLQIAGLKKSDWEEFYLWGEGHYGIVDRLTADFTADTSETGASRRLSFSGTSDSMVFTSNELIVHYHALDHYSLEELESLSQHWASADTLGNIRFIDPDGESEHGIQAKPYNAKELNLEEDSGNVYFIKPYGNPKAESSYCDWYDVTCESENATNEITFEGTEYSETKAVVPFEIGLRDGWCTTGLSLAFTIDDVKDSTWQICTTDETNCVSSDTVISFEAGSVIEGTLIVSPIPKDIEEFGYKAIKAKVTCGSKKAKTETGVELFFKVEEDNGTWANNHPLEWMSGQDGYMDGEFQEGSVSWEQHVNSANIVNWSYYWSQGTSTITYSTSLNRREAVEKVYFDSATENLSYLGMHRGKGPASVSYIAVTRNIADGEKGCVKHEGQYATTIATIEHENRHSEIWRANWRDGHRDVNLDRDFDSLLSGKNC